MIYSKKQLENMQRIADYHLSKHPEKQIIQGIQELGELISELTRYYKGECIMTVPNKLLEEYFDVDFMMYQLRELIIVGNGLEHEYRIQASLKLSRELERHGLIE